MEKLALKYETCLNAIESFKKGIALIEKAQKQEQKSIGPFDYEEIYRSLRDSLIQRFEYSVDLLWKYLKVYLQEIHKSAPQISSPKNIIRTATSFGILTEAEAIEFMEMIESRNATSHIYREELANIVNQAAPKYLKLMEAVLRKTSPSNF